MNCTALSFPAIAATWSGVFLSWRSCTLTSAPLETAAARSASLLVAAARNHGFELLSTTTEDRSAPELAPPPFEQPAHTSSGRAAATQNNGIWTRYNIWWLLSAEIHT